MPFAALQQAFQLALQYHRAGHLREAEALYRQVLTAEPNHADALHFLGILAIQSGDFARAIEYISQSTTLSPNNAAMHSHLGEAYRATGRSEEAVASAHRAIELAPNYPVAHYNMALALADCGRSDDAMVAYRAAVRLDPNSIGAHNNLGNLLREKGQMDEAITEFRRVIHLNPTHWEALNNLGNTLKDQGQLADAIDAYRRAIQSNPDAAYVHSNLVYALYFLPHIDNEIILNEQRRWNRKFGCGVKPSNLPHPNDQSSTRRLRIGYVSSDFRDHVVGRNLIPLFRQHKHLEFETFCYAGVMNPDKLSEEFRYNTDHWRITSAVTDQALVDMIRQDKIDILVDLTQHMSCNRLPTFAQIPAPTQSSFAGYPESTGLESIGCRISDKWLELGGEPKPDGTIVKPIGHEQVYLIDSFWCYDPCGMDVEVNDLPAQEPGPITFGSLNNFCKVNEPLLKLWARALGAVTGSRLIILSHEGSHRQRTLQFLETEGVAPNRVEFVKPCPRKEYMELYHRFDIALDTFPYNGHTTSLDALWMGVPVISLCGECPVSRAGLSQLSNLGLPELVAFTEDQYVEIATNLANDIPRLKELRSTLRHRMEKSVLMDGPHFARQIEACYRSMWRRWCESQNSEPGRAES